MMNQKSNCEIIMRCLSPQCLVLPKTKKNMTKKKSLNSNELVLGGGVASSPFLLLPLLLCSVLMNGKRAMQSNGK